eukprot:1008082_1
MEYLQDVIREHDLSSFLRGGLRTNPYLVFASSGDGQSSLQQKTEKKQYSIKRAKEILIEQELKKYLSDHDLANQAVELAENDGIVFIDEIDKICGSRNSSYGGGERRVSQEGVQRDLLPLIEGTSVTVQNYGKINTDHILFICAGAFHDSKPSDLMPEFQGRLPVRVNLKPLTKNDMIKILSCTQYNLINQQIEMLKTELIFTNDAINEIAQTAVLCNENVENIGARRLVTVIEATQSCYRWWEQDCSTATIGGDHDAFGYSTSYGWCSATNKCCRPWEDTCSSIGSDKDEHVCILSAGYSYCVSPATASTPPIPPTTPPT